MILLSRRAPSGLPAAGLAGAFRPGHGRPGFRRFGLDLARRHGPAFPVDVEDDAVRVLELAFEVVRVAEIEEEFPAGLLDPFLLLLEVVALEDEWWIPTYSSRRENNTESLLGMLFITSVRYWINFVHTAKYKIKPHAIAIDTSQIAILPSLGTCP